MRQIDDIVEQIRAREETRKGEAERIRTEAQSTMFTDGGAAEPDFVHTVETADLDGVTVAGVDGGMVRKALHGTDLIMTRAVAAVFSYAEGELDGAEYVPATSPDARIEFFGDVMDRTAVDRLATLQRLEDELREANRVVEDVDVLLLDGALAPQFPDKPAKGSPLRERYTDVVQQYVDLYEAARETGTVLASVVEDTRSDTLCTVLRANGFSGEAVATCRDVHILSYLLEEGERTLAMRYSATADHPVLKDLKGYGDALYSSYLKAVRHDAPIRVDVFAPEDPAAQVDAAARSIAALSVSEASYAVPALLIEADQRAKFSQHEVELVTRRIRHRLAHLPGGDGLRRDKRPF